MSLASLQSIDAIRANLRNTVRRGIDWIFAATALLAASTQFVGLGPNAGPATWLAFVISVGLGLIAVLGLLGRATWTPLAYVVVMVIGNVAYLVAYGPLVGIGAAYVAIVALTFTFAQNPWRWFVVAALGLSIVAVGVSEALGDHPPVVDFSDGWMWARTTLVATAAMGLVILTVRYCTQQLVVARQTLHRALEAERSAASEQSKINEDIVRTRRADLIVELASDVGVDIGAALQRVSRCAETLAREISDDDAQQCLADVITAAEAAGSTMRSLTVFGGSAISDSSCDAARVTRDLPRIIRRLIPDRITLELTTCEEAWVPISATDLTRILSNLVLNARDAIPQAGALDVTVARTATTVTLEVRDSGSGMDAQTVAKLFQPFFTTKSIGRGTGLGLATTKILVERAGGTIRVTSERGAGTVFMIELPIITSPAERRGP